MSISGLRVANDDGWIVEPGDDDPWLIFIIRELMKKLEWWLTD